GAAFTQLQYRAMDEVLKLKTASRQSPELTELLVKHHHDHGLVSTLYLLDQISNMKTAVGKRFNSVAAWPKTRDSQYLHLTPNVGQQSVNAMAEMKPVRLKNMMDPSFDPTLQTDETKPLKESDYKRTIQGREVSNAELLITDLSTLKEMIKDLGQDEQAFILKDKKKLDDYYRHTAGFPITLAGKRFTMTVPTSRYTERQFLAVSETGRSDIQKIASQKKDEKFMKLVDTQGPSKAKTVTGFSSDLSALPTEETQRIAKESLAENQPDLIRANNADIAAMADLIAQLPPNSFIGQNSLDTSTDAKCEHLQIFLDAPTELIPLFNAPSQEFSGIDYTDGKRTTQSIECNRVNSHGSIYKFTTSSNDEASRTFLESVQNQFLAQNTCGSSMNLISRKVADGKYEHYFVLRKSIAEGAHPELQTAAKAKGSNRPGWFEMLLVRIGKQEDFKLVSDQEYQKIVDSFKADPRDCSLFEHLVHQEMGGISNR
ncbi:MAG: hypothetical protein EB051_01410, partial [Chlamydiia bacterium]|nr:hypothetical protein [Chlamydiia bacterium]